MAFIFLVAFSALFVAGCAAFFSIKGLIVLFSGSALAIGIMASSLEIGKLVAASFLHTYWNKISALLKLYLCLAVMILMCITSLGIFGFLTGAYQIHASTVGSFETKITALQNEKQTVDRTIEESAERVKALTEMRAAQEQRVKDSGNFKAPRDQAYKAIAEANEEIQRKELIISSGRERAIALEKDIAELQISLNTTTDVGSFRFIASALNTDVTSSVQYFIFALIAVFDPLAVALVLCWNNLLEQHTARKKEDDMFIENILNTPAQHERERAPILNTPLYDTHTEKPVIVTPQPIATTPEVIIEAAIENVGVTGESTEKVIQEPVVFEDPVITQEKLENTLVEIDSETAARLEKERIEIANRKRMAGDNNSVIIH